MLDTSKVLKTDAKVTFGTDPEVFLSKDGRIVGSEKAIPETGLESHGGLAAYGFEDRAKIVRDGVQVELHPPATHCREWLAVSVGFAIKKLLDHLKDQQFQVSLLQTVEVSKEELESLSGRSRELGCQPSFNWYAPEKDLGVDPAKYPKRSAAGHLHFGLPESLMPHRDRLPPVFDILLGLVEVQLNRDPAAAERRKVYGRAGEFRLPRHGIEYRTTSNFWLKAPELLSLMTGLGRLGVWILDTEVSGKWEAVHELFQSVDLGEVEQAINTNDFQLARKNFEGVKRFLREHTPKPLEAGLDGTKLEAFDRFVDKGLDYWFIGDPLLRWAGHAYGNGGWEKFLERVGQGL